MNNMKFITAALFALALMTPGVSQALGKKLSAGKYTATLTPAPTEEVADKIESDLGKIAGLAAVNVDPMSASLQFTVQEGSTIKESAIEDAVKVSAPDTKVGKAAPEAAASEPAPPAEEPATPSTGN